MDKKKKIVIAIFIIIIAALTVTLCALEMNNSKKENNEAQENVVNEIIEENVVSENEINNVVNSTDNENLNNEITSSISNPPNTVYQSDEVYNSNSDVGTTNKKEEAINLVKQEWGEDSTVTFSCDSVTTKGEYIIAVTSLETATVKSYFRVNLENKTVTVEF